LKLQTFVGDTIRLDVNAGIDLSGYTDLYIKFKRPNGSMGFWAATLDPGDDTHMYYDTDVTDLNMPGTWVVQAHAEAANIHLHGLWTDFIVYTPLAETSTPPTTLTPTTAP
jgi:nitrogen fixation protein FixH